MSTAFEPSIAAWHALWTPPEKLSLSQWAELYFTLSTEYSARSGPLKLRGWQKAILDAFTDERVEQIVMMTGTQLFKTLAIQIMLAYIVVEQPGPTLLIEPKDADAKAFSRERLSPMLRDMPVLQGLVREHSAKEQDRGTDTLLQKDFKGGSLALAGSIAPGNLARRSIRYLFMDEVDKYVANAGNEGDPLSLAMERLVTFGTRSKAVMACSPTTDAKSRIARAYEASDQRKPWVPCHACGEHQVLEFNQVKFDDGQDLAKRAKSAHYTCKFCSQPWSDVQRWAACEQAEWRQEKPFAGIAGFWISGLYSPHKKIGAIVQDFLIKKQNRLDLQVFVNTTLAELWKEESQTADDEHLYARREEYPWGPDAIVPMRGVFLTCGVDVQDDRLEYEVVAWGRGKESWSVDYGVIQAHSPTGQPLPVTDPQVWAKLDELLQREWSHDAGGTLPIHVMAIDTGYKPTLVYDFAIKHPQPAYAASGLRVHAVRTVVPIKGTDDDLQVIAGVSKEDAARKRQGVKIVSVGTHIVKQQLYDSLRNIRPSTEPVMNACHFPQYDREYFAGLCGEQRIQRGDKTDWVKKSNCRNEPLDCRVYARAAATMLGVDRFNEKHWKQLETPLGVHIQPAPQIAPKPAAPAVTSQPAPHRTQQRRTTRRLF